MEREQEEHDYFIFNPEQIEKEENKGDFEDECSFEFTDLRKESRTEEKLETYDPKKHKKYMVVYPGLNFKAFCGNDECDSKKSKLPVWIKKDYGEFDIGREMTKNTCPCCTRKLSSKSIRTVGYMYADVSFEGNRVIGEQDEEVKYTDSEKKGLFVKFKDFDQNMCKWTHLSVKVEKNK